MAIKLEDFIPAGTNIFGARTPTYLEGLITSDQLKKAQQQSLFQGLLGTAVGYLAQPKIQNYGSAVPYLAKGYMQGMEMAQTPFSNLEKDVLMKEKFDAIAREKRQQKALDEVLSSGGLYKATTTGGERTTPYQPVMKDGEAVAPDFTAPTYTPKTTTYDFDLGQIDKLISSGNISAANTLMDIESKRRKALADMRFGQILSDEQAQALGLRVDKRQKYFRNKEGKPELIQGQMLTDSELSAKRDQYKLITDETGTYYIPKDPNSKLNVLQRTDSGNLIEVGTYTKFKEFKADIPRKEELDAAYMTLKGFGVDNNTAMDAASVVRDKAKDLMKKYQQGTGQEISFSKAVELITKAAKETGAFDEEYIDEFKSELPIEIDFDVDGNPMMFDGKNWRYIK